MCIFGDETKIINELNLTEPEAIFGWRVWRNLIDNRDKNHLKLKSLNQEYYFPYENQESALITRSNSEGYYNNNYNYNYNNYYNNNYNYNNYYNNNYNYNNYYNYNYYYYNNYYNYNYLVGTCRLWGKVFVYKDGYRSEFAMPESLLHLEDKRWFEDSKTKEFAEHFNERVKSLIELYNIRVITKQQMDSLWQK